MKRNLLLLFLMLDTVIVVIILYRHFGLPKLNPVMQNTQNQNAHAVPVLQFIYPLTIGENTLRADVAATNVKRAQGLSRQNSLDNDQALVFDFKNAGQKMPGFWMKEMKFDLDLIWVRDNQVIGITPNVPAPKTATEQLPKYFPPSPIDMVIEVSAGWTAAHNVTTGAKISIELPEPTLAQ